MEAIIRYKVHSQKIKSYFSDILKPEILVDICFLVTKQKCFKVVKDNEGYNKGRLVTIEYDGVMNYVSLSETQIGGRNSSIQSMPTALNIFFADTAKKKNLYYYVLPHNGNLNTDYHNFIYRLMLTAGFKFLNEESNISEKIIPLKNIEDIVNQRDSLKGNNSSNNSTYITKSADAIQIYGKTYGASKYETTLICVAISMISTMKVELFNICEQDLKRLPESSIATLNKLGKVTIIDTNLKFEKQKFLEQKEKTVLRSPIYIYNLLQTLGQKKCALCGCEIPEIIQGAHIWAVSDISKEKLSDDEKIKYATDGHNGLWLCHNHHKLFDTNIISITNKGKLDYSKSLSDADVEFLDKITTIHKIESRVMNKDFKFFLKHRNMPCSGQ